MTVQALTLIDFSDRDLLYALEDTADSEGWATSKEIADQIGIDNKHPAQCVGSRLGWLKRFKIPLDTKVEEGERFWRLTANATAIIHPKKIPVAAERALDGLDEIQRVKVTETIARGAARGSIPATHLARRAWNHSMDAWRDPSLSNGKK